MMLKEEISNVEFENTAIAAGIEVKCFHCGGGTEDDGVKGTLVRCDYGTGAVHKPCWSEYLNSTGYKGKCAQAEAQHVRYLTWQAAGRNIKARVKKRRAEGEQIPFEVGDWLVQGEDEGFITVVSKDYDSMEQLTTYKRATLQKFAYVARHVPACIRVCKLTWAHHQLVAPLERSQQQVMLKWAAENKQSVSATRKAINEWRGKQQQQGKPSMPESEKKKRWDLSPECDAWQRAIFPSLDVKDELLRIVAKQSPEKRAEVAEKLRAAAVELSQLAAAVENSTEETI
jgi:hypothetical protein